MLQITGPFTIQEAIAVRKQLTGAYPSNEKIL